MNLIKGGDLDNAIVVVENPVPADQLEHLKKIFNKPDIEIKAGYLNNLRTALQQRTGAPQAARPAGRLRAAGRPHQRPRMGHPPRHFANTEFMKQLKHTIRRAGEKPRFQYDCRKPPLHDINDIRHMLPPPPAVPAGDRIFHRDATDVAGIKNVTMNEPFFVGHFPEEPVMPGVLIVEAMAQCSGILVLGDVPDPENYSTYFMKIDGVKFKRKVVPGDTLQFEIHLMEPIRRGVAVVEAKAFVGETLACEAVLMAQVVKNKNNKSDDQQSGIHPSRRQNREQCYGGTVRLYRRRRRDRRRLLDRARRRDPRRGAHRQRMQDTYRSLRLPACRRI